MSEKCIKSDQINEDWKFSTQDQSLLGLEKHCTTISLSLMWLSITLDLWRILSMEHTCMIPYDRIKHNRKSVDLLTSWKQTWKFVHDYISIS